MKKTRVILLLALAIAAAAAACDGAGDGKQVIPDGEWLALVVTTDYQTGSYAVVDAESLDVASNVGIIHDDSVCRFDGMTATPFVVARLGADAVDVLDPRANWEVANEYSVSPSSNPQDIAVVSDERAYVTRYGDPEVLVVHPTDGTVIDTVDLSPWADADGNPEASWALLHDETLFVTIQKLDNFMPTGASSVLEMDPLTGEVQGEFGLSGANVYGKLRYNEKLEKIVLIESGFYGDNDGGIELLDPVTGELSGFIASEEQLGGDLSDAVIVDDTKGYAVVGVPFGDGVHNRLISFDPSTGDKIADILVYDSWSLGFIELSPDGERLWISDRTPEAPGIRVFSTATDEEITAEPVDVGLPPFMICFAPAGSKDDIGTDPGLDASPDGGEDDGGIVFEYWLADEVVEAPGHTGEGNLDSFNAINGVHGAGTAFGNTDDVFSLGTADGADNYIVLGWSGEIVANGPGTDFVVYENAFGIGASSDCFMDQAVVSVSRDLETWVVLPHDYTASDEGAYSADPEHWRGFAGVRPVLFNEETNPVDPFDPALAGGDHFDLDDIEDGSAAAAEIKAEGFRYLMITTAPTLVNPDTGAAYVQDPASNGTDLDGVAARYLASER